MIEKLLPSLVRNSLWNGYSIIQKLLLSTKKYKLDRSDSPKLTYALTAPKEGEVVGGGRVKLIYLSRRFPESFNRFNILYLVSSALPRHFEVWIEGCKKKGIKIVLNQNGVAYPGCYPAGWQQINKSLKKAFVAADYIIYQSNFCKSTADIYLGEPSQPFEILYNPVDTTSLKPSAKQHFDPKRFTLLLGGNQYEQYRYETALKTLSLLLRKGIEANMIISGKLNWTADEQEVKNISERLVGDLGVGSHIEFTGPYQFGEATNIINKAHILLHTKFNDPCPGAVIEAMACGLPVVYSNSGGTPELVGDAGIGVDSGRSYEQILPPDPDRLAEAVLSIAVDYQNYSEHARRRAVGKFDSRLWLARHEEAFKKVLGF